MLDLYAVPEGMSVVLFLGTPNLERDVPVTAMENDLLIVKGSDHDSDHDRQKRAAGCS